MVTAQERMKILQMLQEGKITPESAAQLLEAMGEGVPDPAPAATPAPTAAPVMADVPEAGPKPRWLRVRVTDSGTGRPRVNVRVPLGLVGLGLKLGAKYSPEIESIDAEALVQAIQSGETGAFVDVFDEDDGEHVEVFLE